MGVHKNPWKFSPIVWEEGKAPKDIRQGYREDEKKTLQFVSNEMTNFKDHESKLDIFTQDLYLHI